MLWVDTHKTAILPFPKDPLCELTLAWLLLREQTLQILILS